MIDINELRRLVQDCKLAGSPVFVRVADMNELLDRLEAAESDALRARIEAAEELVRELQRNLSSGMWRVLREENEELRARIEEMEKQEPVAQVGVHKTGGNAGIAWSARPLNEFDSLPLLREGDRLYLAPGAQPAPIIPEGWKPIPEKHPTFDLVDGVIKTLKVLDCSDLMELAGMYGEARERGDLELMSLINARIGAAIHEQGLAAPEAKP